MDIAPREQSRSLTHLEDLACLQAYTNELENKISFLEEENDRLRNHKVNHQLNSSR